MRTRSSQIYRGNYESFRPTISPDDGFAPVDTYFIEPCSVNEQGYEKTLQVYLCMMCFLLSRSSAMKQVPKRKSNDCSYKMTSGQVLQLLLALLQCLDKENGHCG